MYANRIPEEFAPHVRLMGDMMVLAFQADVTRIWTFIFEPEGSGRSYPEIGVRGGHHNLSHHGGKAEMVEQIMKIERHHAAQFAYLLEKLKAIRESDETLLDHCMIAYDGRLKGLEV